MPVFTITRNTMTRDDCLLRSVHQPDRHRLTPDVVFIAPFDNRDLFICL